MGAPRFERTFEQVDLSETETAPGGALTPYAGGLDAGLERLVITVPVYRHPALEVSGGAA